MKLIAPVVEHEPQRVRCSRIVSFVYARAERGDGLVEARGDLGARRAPVPALDRRARLVGGDEQRVAAAVRARAAGLGREREVRAEEGHVPGGHGQALARGAHLGQPALDPRAQLGHGERGLALARARGQRDLHAVVRVDRHAHAARTRRAADRVVHGPERTRPRGSMPGRS